MRIYEQKDFKDLPDYFWDYWFEKTKNEIINTSYPLFLVRVGIYDKNDESLLYKQLWNIRKKYNDAVFFDEFLYDNKYIGIALNTIHYYTEAGYDIDVDHERMSILEETKKEIILNEYERLKSRLASPEFDVFYNKYFTGKANIRYNAITNTLTIPFDLYNEFISCFNINVAEIKLYAQHWFAQENIVNKMPSTIDIEVDDIYWQPDLNIYN